jgi:glycosyltransferase involved in cell wall biosynthesis
MNRPPARMIMKILYVDTCIGLAGGQYSLIEIIRALDRSRVHPIVCSPEESELRSRCSDLGVEWLRLRFQSDYISTEKGSGPGRLTDAMASCLGIIDIARAVRRHRVDLVHANTFKAGLVAGFAGMFHRAPMVFHDRILIEHNVWGRFVASRAVRIVAVSGAVAGKRVNAGRGGLVVIPDGVDVRRLQPGRCWVAARSVRYLGRLSREKGLHNLVECAPQVIGKIPDARFVIGGEPFTAADRAYLAGIRAQIESAGLGAAFEFVGRVGDVAEFLGGAEVFVLPSEREALGIALLEAMALERPAVAVRAGGPDEIISDGQDGLLVPRGDSLGLAAAIVRLLEDRELAGKLGRRARETVVSRFDSRDAAKRITALYDEVLTGKDAGCRG